MAYFDSLPRELIYMIVSYLEEPNLDKVQRSTLKDLHALTLTSPKLYHIAAPSLYRVLSIKWFFDIPFFDDKACRLQARRLISTLAPCVRQLRVESKHRSLQLFPCRKSIAATEIEMWTTFVPMLTRLQSLTIKGAACISFIRSLSPFQPPVRELRIDYNFIGQVELKMLLQAMMWPRLQILEVKNVDMCSNTTIGIAGLERQGSNVTSLILQNAFCWSPGAPDCLLELPRQLEHLEYSVLKSDHQNLRPDEEIGEIIERRTRVSLESLCITNLRRVAIQQRLTRFKNLKKLEISLNCLILPIRWEDILTLNLRELVLRLPESGSSVPQLAGNLILHKLAANVSKFHDLELTLQRANSKNQLYINDSDDNQGNQYYSISRISSISDLFKNTSVRVVWPSSWLLFSRGEVLRGMGSK